nr:hypothetical protein [Tanacetum cinerariifolium]
MLENQKNVKSRTDKGYHAVPPPYTENYIPPKPDIMFIDEQVESDTIETKPVRKNNFIPPIIEDWISDDESEVEFESKVKVKTVRPCIKKINLLRLPGKHKRRLKLKELMELSTKLSDRVLDLEKIKTAQAKEERNLKQMSIFKESDFDVQAMMDADYKLAARLIAEEQRRKPLTKSQKRNQI